MSGALIVMDLQRGVFSGGQSIPPVADAHELIERAVSALEKARSADVPVVFVQHGGPPGHLLEEGSSRWELHPDLRRTRDEPLVQKDTPDAFLNTGLHELLGSLGTHRIAVAGIQTEFCVDTTCRRAKSFGYEVTLLSDAHSTWDSQSLTAAQIREHHNYVLGDSFVTLVETAKLQF